MFATIGFPPSCCSPTIDFTSYFPTCQPASFFTLILTSYLEKSGHSPDWRNVHNWVPVFRPAINFWSRTIIIRCLPPFSVVITISIFIRHFSGGQVPPLSTITIDTPTSTHGAHFHPNSKNSFSSSLSPKSPRITHYSLNSGVNALSSGRDKKNQPRGPEGPPRLLVFILRIDQCLANSNPVWTLCDIFLAVMAPAFEVRTKATKVESRPR